MRDFRRNLLVGLLFGALVVAAMTLIGDLRQITSDLLKFQWGLLPLILGASLVNFCLRFAKWHYFVRLTEHADLAWRESARVFLAGFPLVVTPGKIGEVLKGVWLNQATGIPVARGVTVVLAERISDGLAMTLLSVVGVIAFPRYWPAFAVAGSALVAAVVIFQLRPLALQVLAGVRRLPWLRGFAGHLEEFYLGSSVLLRPKATLVGIALGTLGWLAEGIGTYLVLVGLGVPPGIEALSTCVFIYSFSTIVGTLSALPGGLGATEASMAGMLSALLRLDRGLAVTATLLLRFATLWFAVAIGLAVWSQSPALLLPAKASPEMDTL